jgi:hypothetical protein
VSRPWKEVQSAHQALLQAFPQLPALEAGPSGWDAGQDADTVQSRELQINSFLEHALREVRAADCGGGDTPPGRRRDAVPPVAGEGEPSTHLRAIGCDDDG